MRSRERNRGALRVTPSEHDPMSDVRHFPTFLSRNHYEC
jgi:hypothetical protein